MIADDRVADRFGALGRHDVAAWLRRQPATSASHADSAMSRRLSELDAHGFGTTAPDSVSYAGEVAAHDALCRLPHDLGGGVLGFSGRLGALVFTHALSLPDGADRVGQAVSRVQRDAVRAVIAATAPTAARAGTSAGTSWP